MASRDDATPYSWREPKRPRLTASTLLVLLHLAGFVATGILTRGGRDPGALAFLEFDVREAVGNLQLWQFFTWPYIQVSDFVTSVPATFAFLGWFLLAVYALFVLGNELEEDLGRARFLVLYAAACAYGALAHSLVQTLAPESADVRAASLLGPAAGIAAAATIRDPGRPVLFLFLFPVRRAAAVLLAGGAGLACALFLFPWAAPAALGAVAAAAAVVALEPVVDGWVERTRLRRERDRFLGEIELRRETEVILDKISQQGMSSLTRQELRTLRGASALMNRERGGDRG